MTKREGALGGIDDTVAAGVVAVPATTLTGRDPERYADRVLVSEGGMGRIFLCSDQRIGQPMLAGTR